MREQIEKLVKNIKTPDDEFYLTTGRTIVHYNNAAQTVQCEPLNSRYSEDVVLACIDDKEKIGSDKIIMRSDYGETTELSVKYVKSIKPGTLFTTFHHERSHINYLFGDEADELIMTARFKSVKVNVESV